MPLDATLYQQAQFANAGLQFLAGNFTFNGSSQPDAAEGKPFAAAGTDLVRDSEGVYTLTVPGRGALDFLSIQATLEDASLDLYHTVSAVSEANRTITFSFFSDTGVADDPTDGGKLHVLLVLKSRQV